MPRIDLGRPKVRLLYNEQYRRIDPVEINLHLERDVSIEPAMGAEKRAAA